MLQALADLTIEGSGIVVRLRGDGPVLVADVTGDVRSAARIVRSVGLVVRFARAASRSLRALGMRVDVRVRGRTFVRLG